MRIKLIFGDITKILVDVMVNSANKSLLAGSGVCGAIHKAAGPKLEQECQDKMRRLNLKFIKTGTHIVTKAYNLPGKWVIHTVGPKYNEDISLLRWCYIRAVVNADDLGAKSISFPAISTGRHHISIETSAKNVKIALWQELPRLLQLTNLQEVRLIFDKIKDFNIYKKVFEDE